MADSGDMSRRQPSLVTVDRVRIRNFRSLRCIDVDLGPLTVLVGENNSGKTNFMQALIFGLSASPPALDTDDIFAGASSPGGKGKTVIVDCRVVPINEDGDRVDTFDDFWLATWGEGVQQDDLDRDFVGIRTFSRWNATRGAFHTERVFLREWLNPSSDLEGARVGAPILRKQMEPISIDSLDAQRDIEADFARRSSFWRRLVDEHGIPDQEIRDIEAKLDELNQRVVESSEAFTHVQRSLNRLTGSTMQQGTGVVVAPIARRMTDLSRGMNVLMQEPESRQLPLGRFGMGTRSLAAIFIWQALGEWRQSANPQGKVHPILSLEEPEAHLHPQAQRQVIHQITDMPGQRVVSTHSPYIAANCDLSTLRLFRREGSESVVTAVGVSELTPDELRKIRRSVFNTRGEVVFAKALILFEGETEEQVLPGYAEEVLGNPPGAFGISMLSVGGFGSYRPFAVVAEDLGIPWWIYSDGEQNVVDSITALHAEIVGGDPLNLHILPDGADFEGHLIQQGFAENIEHELRIDEGDDFLNEYIRLRQGQPYKKGRGTRDYTTTDGREVATRDYLKENRTKSAQAVLQALLRARSEGGHRLDSLERLLDEVCKKLGVVRNGS